MINTVSTQKNGITNVIFNLMRELVRFKDISIEYISISEIEESYLRILNDLKIKFHIIPRSITNTIGYVKSLSLICREFDIVHAHGNSATMVLEMLAAKIGGVKLRIAHSHNTKCSMKLIDKMMRPIFYKLCNGKLACGDEAGSWLFPNSRFSVINNGINTDKYRYSKEDADDIRSLLRWEDKIILGNIGNFVDQKNHGFIIRIFKELSSLDQNLRLILVGNGPNINEIKNLAQNIGIIDKIYFTGSVDNPEKYMSASDLIVMPSLYEGFPLTLVEEQANGLKIICSDTITQKTNLTGNINFISLDSPTDIWLNKIKDEIDSNYNRNEFSIKSIEMIKKQGFDIKSNALDLYNYYKLNCSNE